MPSLRNQEGVTTIPKGSRGKRPEARDSRRKLAEEIVCSAWRHAAVRKDGDGLANHPERLALLLGITELIKYSVFDKLLHGTMSALNQTEGKLQ